MYFDPMYFLFLAPALVVSLWAISSVKRNFSKYSRLPEASGLPRDDAARRLRHFPGDTSTSLFIWLRMIVTQTMIDLHRRHLGTLMRDAGREVSLGREAPPDATSTSIALELAGDLTSPSQAAVRAELPRQLEEALDGLDPIDRAVLPPRHLEEPTTPQAPAPPEIPPKAPRIRHAGKFRGPATSASTGKCPGRAQVARRPLREKSMGLATRAIRRTGASGCRARCIARKVPPTQ